jgi:light-harvesting protein B-800-850 alpha chain
MNQGRIWLVVNPNIGLPLFFVAIVVTSLLIHMTVLTHTTWFSAFFQGHAKPAAVTAPATP